MTNIFLISDTHFNHANILKFTNLAGQQTRPEFGNLDEMNEHIIDRWNSVVGENDLVYHLGDVYFGKQNNEASNRSILRRLKGKKHLILGNHDDAKDPVLHEFFDKITMWHYLRDHGMTLSHIPLHETTLNESRHGEKALNIHGHIHRNPSPSKRHINVSVEQINYTPVAVEDAPRIIR